MSPLSSIVTAPFIEALGTTLLHFLWQGAAAGAVLFLMLRLGRFTAATRYAMGVGTLVAMAAAPLATFALITTDATTGAATSAVPGASAALATKVSIAADTARAMSGDGWSPTAITALVWAVGVVVLGIRLAGGWVLARRLVRQGAEPASQEIQALARRVADRLALTRVVRVAQSSAVVVPMMVGWLKPVVLFPAGVLSGLSPMQIEALLAHELAHIRRHDYLVNLLQSVVETLLFYHPAVWWVSRRVRVEREHCCDDMAVAICDRLVYATALGELAARAAGPHVALAATDGSLLHRVRRILEGTAEAQSGRTSWLPMLAIVFVAGAAVTVLLASGRDAEPSRRHLLDPPAVQEARAIETVPEGRPQVRALDDVPPHDGAEASLKEVSPEAEDARAAHLALPPHEAVAEAQSQTERERARQAQLEEMQRQAAREMEEVQRALRALERQRLEVQLKADVDALMTELEAARRELARGRQLVETGLLSPGALARLERDVAALERRVVTTKVDHELAARQSDLLARQAEKNREIDRVLLERALTDDERRATLERLLTDQELYERVKRTTERLEPVASSPTTEPARAGDFVLIDIHSEPDVPRAYTVAADGTIKLPLSAPLRVAGLTAGEIQMAIVKQLTARGLSNVAAEVEVRRPR